MRAEKKTGQFDLQSTFGASERFLSVIGLNCSLGQIGCSESHVLCTDPMWWCKVGSGEVLN